MNYWFINPDCTPGFQTRSILINFFLILTVLRSPARTKYMSAVVKNREIISKLEIHLRSKISPWGKGVMFIFCLKKS